MLAASHALGAACLVPAEALDCVACSPGAPCDIFASSACCFPATGAALPPDCADNPRPARASSSANPADVPSDIQAENSRSGPSPSDPDEIASYNKRSLASWNLPPDCS